jgi:hypothetical protein
MKGDEMIMISFTVLSIMAVVLLIIAITAISVLGTVGFIIFGDLIACVFLIVLVIKYLVKRRR